MQTIKVATSYVDNSVFRKMGESIVSDYPVEGFKGTRTVAKLQEGRTYNFVTKVVNDGTNYKAVLVVSGNRVTREFNADGEDQTFSITLGSGEDGLYINNSENVGVIVSYNQEADFDPKPADFKTPQPFRFWCQTVLPLVYDDSLSYYELLSKVVQYLNSLINDVTNVENIYVNLTNAYAELEGYVNTYFDNLDVSEAINEKLDYMADHGDFDSLVQEALSRINYTAIIDAEVDEQLPSVVDTKLGAEVASQIGDVVENQIDDVVGEQIGGAVSDQITETVANQIGGAVANQIGDVVADQIDDAVVRPTENWLARNFTTPPVDKTLSIDNASADAKVTGDIISYIKDISIEGYTRKQESVPQTRITDSYISKDAVGGYAWRIRTNSEFNCAYITNLVGGAKYIIDMYGVNPTIVENGAGWLCRNLVRDGAIISATEIDTLEHFTGHSAIGGRIAITLPYNCDSLIINSTNATLINVYLATMEFEGHILPDVTNSDNGKILSVVNGEWNKANIPDGNLPVVSSADNGKVLQVSEGTWGVGEDLVEISDNVDELENHYTITPAFNLFDPSTLEVGKYCISTSLVRSSDDRYNLLTIPVEAGHSYLVAKASDTSTQGTQTGWSAVVFCDSDMNGLSVIRVATDSQYGAFEVPSGASFAVISYYASNTTPVIVEHAIPTTWTTRFDPEAANTAPTYSVADDVIIPVDTLGESGKNIIDESKMISGYVNSALWTDSATYVSTKIIPVKPNTTYYSRTNLRYVSLYNSNKEYTHGFSDAALTYFTTDGNDVYARITAYSADVGKIMVSTDENAFYEPYKKVFVEGTPFLNEAQKNDVGEYLFPDNVLKGKKWVVCGDSFSSYGGVGTSDLTEGIYEGEHYVYPYIIGNRTGARIVSFASGGRTLGYNDNANSLTCPTADCYYQNIPADADYITIYLGINDDDYGITLGTISDADSSTYLGAYNEVISWLIEHRPFAHIGIIVSNATEDNTWTLGQIAIAEKYGVPYLNLNGDARTPAVFRSTNPNIPSAIKAIVNEQRAVDWDGSITGTANKHPNDETQLFESTIIENFLKSL